MHHHYSAFGLKIVSEILMPELIETDFSESPDLTIVLGTVPITLNNAKQYVTFEVNATEYLFKMPNVAHYLLQDHNTIIIEPHTTDFKSIRLFLLSNVMAAVIYRHKKIPLHASAIDYKGELILFAGVSGAGKSTLAINLKNRGYPIFADDVCILSVKNKAIEARPTYNNIKLWQDSLAHYQAQTPQCGEALTYQLRPEIDKYAIPYPLDFEGSPKSIKKIYIFNYLKDCDFDIGFTIESKLVFASLQLHTYRPKYVEAMNLQALHFQTLMTLYNTVPIVGLSRPTNFNLMDDFLTALEKDFEV
jgi:hypothetical protein